MLPSRSRKMGRPCAIITHSKTQVRAVVPAAAPSVSLNRGTYKTLLVTQQVQTTPAPALLIVLLLLLLLLQHDRPPAQAFAALTGAGRAVLMHGDPHTGSLLAPARRMRHTSLAGSHGTAAGVSAPGALAAQCLHPLSGATSSLLHHA